MNEEIIKLLESEPDYSLSYYKREQALIELLKLYKAEKEKNKKMVEDVRVLNCEAVRRQIEYNYISKDKIKAKIEEAENKLAEKRKEKYRTIYEIALEYYIEAYKKLLEE